MSSTPPVFIMTADMQDILTQLHKVRKERSQLKALIAKNQLEIGILEKEQQDESRLKLHQRYLEENWDTPCCYFPKYMWTEDDFDSANADMKMNIAEYSKRLEFATRQEKALFAIVLDQTTTKLRKMNIGKVNIPKDCPTCGSKMVSSEKKRLF